MSETRSTEELKELIRLHGSDGVVESLIRGGVPLTRNEYIALDWAGLDIDEETAGPEYLMEIPEYLSEEPLNPNLYLEIWGPNGSDANITNDVRPKPSGGGMDKRWQR